MGPWASLKLKQRQLPIQRLIPTLSMEATMVLDIITMATLTTATMARDLLRLNLLLMLTPRLKLTPGTDTMDTDMVLDTIEDTMVDIMATPTTDMATATTGASKEGTSNPELTRMKCQHFDDDLPNVLNFREESKRTKQNILLLQTHCI